MAEEIKANGRNLTDFTNFAKKVVKVPQSVDSIRNRYGRSYHNVSSSGFTKDEIR